MDKKIHYLKQNFKAREEKSIKGVTEICRRTYIHSNFISGPTPYGSHVELVHFKVCFGLMYTKMVIP